MRLQCMSVCVPFACRRPPATEHSRARSPDVYGEGNSSSVTTWDRILDIGAVSAAFRETFRFPVREPANMAHAASGLVARQIGSLFDGGSAAGLSDRQLLDRFVARRDAAGEAAFAALVARHGTMVLHVCRQLLGDHQHAEDAFQAVFLVLARRARSVRDPDLLGHWLYGVALRTARKSNARLAPCARTRETKPWAAHLRNQSVRRSVDDRPGRRLGAPRRDREFARCVPPADRTLLLRGALARRGGAPASLSRRHAPQPVSPGADKLRRGLTRRGAFLSTSALAAVLDSTAARAAVSSSLCEVTTKAAISFAAGQVAGSFATGLAREVLKSMLAKKIALAALAILLVGAVATGAGFVGQVPAPRTTKFKPQDRQAGKPELSPPPLLCVRVRAAPPHRS